ncbi:hypothetical protein GCM10009535_26640 [Streptomyces thermocarboxydovorans]|uniref:Histidine kinase/HSP90-like ATPase domain-containing protein n=2 Tax=Streptomyces thermocarboxydovorans TaxID=59298 RepID=A0ABN1HGM6_9ACTN
MPQPLEREAAMPCMTAKRSLLIVPRLHARGAGRPCYDMHLARQIRSAALARRAVRTVLMCWGLPGALVSDAELIACELITNAILHADPARRTRPGHCRLTLERPARHAVRIEVSDNSAALPAKREPGEDEPGGRGLVLVEALAADWGVTLRPPGKVVWALLRTQP